MGTSLTVMPAADDAAASPPGRAGSLHMSAVQDDPKANDTRAEGSTKFIKLGDREHPILTLCPFNWAEHRSQVMQEVLSGVTVSLAQVPEAVAFSFVAQVSPIIGLQSAWMIGVITALFGGRPGMICGATGAIAVVLPPVIAMHGLGGLFYTIIFAGVIQIILGVIRAGSLISLIAFPVMMGFCNGLGMIIGLAQFHSMQKTTNSSSSSGAHLLGGAFGAFNSNKEWVSGAELGWMILHILLAMNVVFWFPRCCKKAPLGLGKFPSALLAIICCTTLEWLILGPLNAEGGGHHQPTPE